MPGNPFKKPFRSSTRSPKVGRPRTPKVSKLSGAKQMPGVTSSPRGTVTSPLRAPKVRVTPAGTKPTRGKAAKGGAPLGTPGKTG